MSQGGWWDQPFKGRLIFADGLGSTTLLFGVKDDNTTGIVGKYVYDSFGQLANICGADAWLYPFRYTGRAWDDFGSTGDANQGLYYLRARYYDPVIGRFLQTDPEWSLTLYQYALSNPINNYDKSGAAVETIIDVATVGWDIYDLARDPSWGKAGMLGVDILATMIPFIPAPGAVVKGAKGVSKAKGLLASFEILRMSNKLKKVDKLWFGPGVLKHMDRLTKAGDLQRPYIKKGGMQLVKEIMQGSKPILDSRSDRALKWLTEGTFNGSKGIWDLVIDVDSGEIIHFLFKSSE